MLASIGLIALGFLAGVLLTGIVACFLIGLLHAEAVRAVESNGMMPFFSTARPAPPTFRAARP